jgi:hypothetical protein
MKRAVRTLIRLVAAGLLVFGGMELGLEGYVYMRHQRSGAEISPWYCIIGAVLIVLGAILFAASSKLAHKLAGDLDE